MLQGIGAALAIVLFVTAHEAGHFIAAKAVGMKATQFFFGFGPKIWSIQRGETEYGFKWIPLGGYVRIIGMNPLEEIAPEDMGRTYREKKFWEKSIVVLAGVGMNFLIAFLLFYAILLSNGIPDPQPIVEEVVPTVTADGVETASPAVVAGLEPDDAIVGIGPYSVAGWEDVTEALVAVGPGPTTIDVDRSGQVLTIEVDLVENTLPDGTVTGFLGVSPYDSRYYPGPVETIGLAGQNVWNGVRFTFVAMGDMLRPSSLAQYLGVFAGNTDIDPEIRPVSPIGIVNIGTQTESLVALVGILALVNVILATINLLPLFPLDGGHFAVALYEKLTGREANVRRLAPVAAAVIGLFAFLGFVAIILDVVDPISLQ
jgi:membrane-associated protease RseP (regulator of RpoE activity)